MTSTTTKITPVEIEFGTAAFVRALQAFHRGERSFLELLQDVDRLLAAGKVSPTDLLARLIDEDRKNPLSAEAFVALERRLRPSGFTDHSEKLKDEDHTVEDDEDQETAVTRWDSALRPALDVTGRTASAEHSQSATPAHRPWYSTALGGGAATALVVGLALVAGYVVQQRDPGVESADAALVDDPAEPTARAGFAGQDETPEAWRETQRQLQEVKGEHEALISAVENRRVETDALRQQLQQVGVQLAARTAELETTRQGLQAAQSEQLERTSELGGLESSVVELQALVDEQKREAEILRSGNEEQDADMRANLQSLQRTEQQLRQSLLERRGELEATRAELAQAQAQLERTAEEQTIGELANLESRVAELQSAVETQKRSSGTAKRDWQETRSTLLGELDSLQLREQKLQQTLQGRDQQLSTLQAELADVKLRAADVQAAAGGDSAALAPTVVEAQASTPVPDTYRLTVTVEPADALVRIMNIQPRYHDGIELAPDADYDISVTADGYEEHRALVKLTEPDHVYPVTLQPRANDPPLSPAPQMARIDGECFQIGSPATERGRFDNERLHEVCVEDFWIGKYEVSIGEFERFVAASGYRTVAERGGGCRYWDGVWKSERNRNWRAPGFKQDDQGHPVVCVSWTDAVRYTQWLSDQLGAPYRLLTEAEWEYAARGGTTTARYWGDDPDDGCRYANLADQTAQRSWRPAWQIHGCDDGVSYTAAMGRYTPNGYGLYDMLGNAWEWTCSAYDEGYGGAETRCAATNQQGGLRAMRGGSLVNTTALVRSAYRNGDSPGERYFNVGFRLARDN